jgi:rubrerythrin
MDIKYTVDEVYEIAEQIERNGGIFYRKAAEVVGDEDAAAKLLDLAEQEDRHEAVFRGLRERLVPEEGRISLYDRDRVVALHLQALANREVFSTSQAPEDVLTGNESLADIIKMAIGKEWDTILYYSAIRGLMGSADDIAAIDEIIHQEEIHVKDLQRGF